jgi:hypothetical protein
MPDTPAPSDAERLGRWLSPRALRFHSLQKPLNRFGASAVYTAVLVIEQCPGIAE